MPARKSSVAASGRPSKPKVTVPGVSGRKTGIQVKRFLKHGGEDVQDWFASSDEESVRPDERSFRTESQNENFPLRLNKEDATLLEEEEEEETVEVVEASEQDQAESMDIEGEDDEVATNSGPEQEDVESGEEEMVDEEENEDELSMEEDQLETVPAVADEEEIEDHKAATPMPVKTKPFKSARIAPSPHQSTPASTRRSSMRKSVLLDPSVYTSSPVNSPVAVTSKPKDRRKSVTFHADIKAKDAFEEKAEEEQDVATEPTQNNHNDFVPDFGDQDDFECEGDFEAPDQEEEQDQSDGQRDEDDDQHESESSSDGEEDMASSSNKDSSTMSSSSSSSKPKSQRRNKNARNVFQGMPNAGLKLVETESGEVVRRSNRKKIAPLEYWRNERVVYGRRKSGFCPVPVVHDVIRVPRDDSDSDGASRRKKKKRTSNSKAEAPNPIVRFMDAKTQEEVEKALVMPLSSVKWNQVHNADYAMANALNDPNNSSLYSGFLSFAKGAEKPIRESGDVSMMCFVIQGTLEVTIHQSIFTAERGCSFCIPKGNQYRIINKGIGEAKIFYVNDRSAAKKKKSKDHHAPSTSKEADQEELS